MSLVVAPLLVLWPGAIALALLDGRRRGAGVLAVGALAATFALLAVLLAQVVTSGPQEVVAGGWPADVGIRLRVDALGGVFALLSCGVLLVSLLQAVITGVVARETPALTLFMGLGLTGLFLTGDVFSFYVFFELAMIAAYALTAARGGGRRFGAAFIFAVVNLVGSFLFLIAIGALYRATGTLEMLAVAERAAPIDANTAILIAVTFFVAFGIKLGLFPFHFWLPAVYLAVSPHTAAMFAGALANIGAYGLLRFGGAILPRELEISAAALIVIGTLSIAYGALQAIARRDTREVLAYSSIGQAGYVLVALGLGGPVGLAAAVIFSIANALTKTLLFLSSELRGRLMAFAFLVGVLSVAGVPPTAGFFGKAALFEAGIDARSIAAVVLLFVGGALSFVYLFQIYQHDRWRPREERHRRMPRRDASRGQQAVALLVAAVVLALGLWPEPLLAIGERAAADIVAAGGEPMIRGIGTALGLGVVYVLTLSSTDPVDYATGVLIGGAIVALLHGRLCLGPDKASVGVLQRVVWFPVFLGAVLADIVYGTWDVTLRVLHVRDLGHPGLVRMPIGERSERGVAVSALATTLSPGSVLLTIDWDREELVFHFIDASDPDRLRARFERFYDRYQRRVLP